MLQSPWQSTSLLKWPMPTAKVPWQCVSLLLLHKLNVLCASTVNRSERPANLWQRKSAIVTAFPPPHHPQVIRPDNHDSTTETFCFPVGEPMYGVFRLRRAQSL